jgi:hypothetical protein
MMTRDLAQLGREYGDVIIAVFDRLCSDDGKTIATEDLRAFETWNASKMLALETQLRGEGATEADLGGWRRGYSDQITLRLIQAHTDVVTGWGLGAPPHNV